jgi:hypothetical protein
MIGDLPPAMAASFRSRDKDNCRDAIPLPGFFLSVSRALALDRDLADIGGDRIVAKSVSAVYQEQQSCLPITLPENRA